MRVYEIPKTKGATWGPPKRKPVKVANKEKKA